MDSRKVSNGSQCVARLRAAPFILCAAYALILAAVLVLPTPEAVGLAAQFLTTSPILCVLLLWIGRPFKFCKWWRAAALLPIVPMIASVFAHYKIGNAVIWLSSVAFVLLGGILAGIMTYTRKEINNQ